MKSVFITVLAVFTAFMTGNIMAVEEAKYTVSVKDEVLEIREYAPSIVAEVIVNGKFENASNTAFRKLFKYISGKNSRRSKIAMTAPVTQESQSEKIAMTAPVGQRATVQHVLFFLFIGDMTVHLFP